MSKLVQVHDVPDDVHRQLKSRAALAGVSLSEYLRLELLRAARRPSPQELRARLSARAPVQPDESAADLVRQARAERE